MATTSHQPPAERLRPRSLGEVVGQLIKAFVQFLVLPHCSVGVEHG